MSAIRFGALKKPYPILTVACEEFVRFNFK